MIYLNNKNTFDSVSPQTESARPATLFGHKALQWITHSNEGWRWIVLVSGNASLWREGISTPTNDY